MAQRHLVAKTQPRAAAHEPWDELETGERKEGTYFAAVNFVQKTSNGAMVMLAGFVLQLTGFEPNVEQSETVKLAMRGLFGFVPFACYTVGVLLFLRFRLTRAEHARIRSELERRAS